MVEQQAPVREVAPARPGSDVFISYSRRDRKVVERLTAALEARGRSAWVDFADIPPTAEWMAEISRAIDAADTVVVVLSPDSVASPVCTEELEAAAAANKRIVPVVVREVVASDVPAELAKRNWLFLRETDDFEVGVDMLVKTLETDLEATRFHTGLLVRAREWEQAGEPKSRLLRGSVLTEGEGYVASPGKGPAPTQEQTSFVLASRRAATRRQRSAIAIASCVALVAATMGVFAWTQRSAALANEREAVEQRERAEEQTQLAAKQAKVANSRALAATALSELDTHLDLAALLAIEAGRVEETPEATRVMQIADQRTSGLDRIIRSHEGSVNGLAFTPDGKTIASGSDDDSVLLSDLASGATIAPPLLLGDDVLSVDISSDGDLLAAGAKDGQVKVWDLSGFDAPRFTIAAHRGWVYEVAFSPDGTILATSGSGGLVRLWDMRTGLPLMRPIEHASWTVVAFDPGGGLMATAATDGFIRFWDPSTGHRSGTPVAIHGDANRIAFSPDGNIMAVGLFDGSIQLIDVEARQTIGTPLRGHSDIVYSVAFSPDGRVLASGGADGTVRLWSVENRRQIGGPLEAHTDAIFILRFAPDGSVLASGGHDGLIVIWDMFQLPLLGHVSGVSTLDISQDGRRIVSGSWDGSIRTWDARDRTEVGPVIQTRSQVTNVELGVGGTIVSAHADGVIRIWDMSRTGDLVTAIRAHQDYVPDIAVSPNGTVVASAGKDGSIRLWAIDSGRSIGPPMRGHTEGVLAIAFSPDGKLLASAGDDSTVRLWDAKTGEPLGQPLRGNLDLVYSVSFSPDGRLVASGGKDGSVRIWDVETGEPVGEPMIQRGWVLSLDFSPDGETLVTGSQLNVLEFWDVSTQELVGEPIVAHADWIWAVAFAPDGTFVASASEDTSIALSPSYLWRVDGAWSRDHLCGIAGRDLTPDEWEALLPFAGYRSTCG